MKPERLNSELGYSASFLLETHFLGHNFTVTTS